MSSDSVSILNSYSIKTEKKQLNQSFTSDDDFRSLKPSKSLSVKKILYKNKTVLFHRIVKFMEGGERLDFR